MKPVIADELLTVTIYDRVRSRLRPLFIVEKDRRRLPVGQHLTLLFENGRTVWYQVQEMIRAERMTEAGAIETELRTYNELLPRAGEITATLLIEYADPAERDIELHRLVGLEQHLWITIDGRRAAAQFDMRQTSAAQISAVQFVRFPVGLTEERFLELARAGRIAVEADHQHMSARTLIEGAVAVALAEDLRAD